MSTTKEATESTSADAENRASVTDCHKLASLHQGASEVEQLADRVDKRRANRIVVTFPVRVSFLKLCRDKADSVNPRRIHRDELVGLRDKIQFKVESTDVDTLARKVMALFGFRNRDATLLRVFDRAICRVDEVDGEWLYYRDFNFYDTKLESRWPWMRSGPIGVAMAIFGFYLFTPILFCSVGDEQVCPSNTGKSYGGWLTAVYFASTTMSTVGYGDVTVTKHEKWSVFIGILYMLLAILVAVTIFSAAAEKAYNLSPLRKVTFRILDKLADNPSDRQLLYQHIRRVKYIRLGEIVVELTILNMIGVFVARAFVNRSEIETQQWDWMTTLYWAVQTTTTIGYGDLDMPFDIRWFQIFYLAFSTAFVGNLFGQIANLRHELKNLQKHYVWQRRECSKRMVEEMQAYEHDDKVDQYEFVLSSLLVLDKVSLQDIQPIMDKFRLLAGDKGFIQSCDIPNETIKEATDVSSKKEELQELVFDED